MSKSSSLDFDLECKIPTNNFLETLREVGWDIFSPEGEVTYLPLNDVDDYNWQFEEKSRDEVYKIIEEKEKNNETAGIVLYWKNTDTGVHLLVWPDGSISFLLNINRKCVKNGAGVFDTDLNWYRETLINGLQMKGIYVTGYSFLEYW